MRGRVGAVSLLGALMLALIALAGEVAAEPVSVWTTFAERFFGVSGGTVPGGTTVFNTPVTSNGDPVSRSDTFNASSSIPPGNPAGEATGTTTGAATVTAAFDASGLRFGASATVTSSVSTPLLSIGIHDGQANGVVSIVDTVTLLAGTQGAPGFLRMAFAIDDRAFAASAVASSGVYAAGALLFDAGIDLAVTRIATGLVVQGSPPGPPEFQGYPIPFPDVFVVDLPATLGTPGLLMLSLTAIAQVKFEGVNLGGGTGNATVDFDSTFTLQFVQVLDAEENPLSDGSVVSDSNFVYPTAVTPEPALSLLMLGALASAIAVRRYRHRSSDR